MKKKTTKKTSPTSSIIVFFIICGALMAIWEHFSAIIIFLLALAIVAGVIYLTYILSHKNKANHSAPPPPNNDETDYLTLEVQFDQKKPTVHVKASTETKDDDLEIEFVRLSTSGDDNVCPMCAQFEGKTFRVADAPPTPLCPSCACAYNYYFKNDLPASTIISCKEDFFFPAKCTATFFKHQRAVYQEKNIIEQIRMCEEDIEKLPEFMAPYLSAGFPAPAALVCRDLLPDLYMRLGEWDHAEEAIQKCIDAKAYSPDDGFAELKAFISYKRISTEALSYIQQNPGCLQRNIYKAFPYEGMEREQLKYFLRYSQQVRKIKHGNTNELYPSVPLPKITVISKKELKH